MKNVLGLGFLLSPLLFVACSEGGAANCVPGMSVACACPDGRMGSQTCNAGGTYDACRCTGSASDGGSGDMGPSSGPKRVFVTSVKYKANGVASMPSICQGAADARSLGGTWKVWLSGLGLGPTGQTAAISRIQSSGPWLLLTGEVVFRNRGQLSTQPETAIRITETKAPVPLNEYVWTGTNLGGSSSGTNCSDWSSTSSGAASTVGDPNSIQGWTDSTTKTCDASHHVYCFED